MKTAELAGELRVTIAETRHLKGPQQCFPCEVHSQL